MSSDSGPPTTVDDAGHSEEAGTSRSRTWRNGLSFTLLTAVALVSFISGLTMGLPVLGHGVRWLWLTAGAAGTVVFAWLAYQPWLELSRRTRIVAAGIPLAVACLVTVGVASNPVVIDGRVLPEWTSQAQSYRYADQMRDSLVTLADMDALLNTDNTQAWSRRGQIERSQAEAESIGLQYQTQIDNGDIPDPLFVTPTRQLVDAAYSAARALELRIVLLDTTDETNLVDEFNAARTVFQTQWTASATGLGSAARTLNLPLTLEVNQ